MQIDLDQGDSIEVQMAPLIDCVFLLLIFFLVATTMKEIKKELPLELPEATLAASETPVEEDLLIIAVDAAGALYLDAEPVTLGILHEEVIRRAAEDPTQPVRIAADRNAPWASVLQICELCKFEGLKDVRPGIDKTRR